MRIFLDSGGAPLRNVHKLEPLIRLPLVLGLAHLLGRVPCPPPCRCRCGAALSRIPSGIRSVAVAALVLAALALSTSLAWTGRARPARRLRPGPAVLAPIPRTGWRDNAADTRALVVPGAPFGSQIWGLTRDEPLQALASTPWAVRDSVPLNPPGTIRAMDSVQRLIADGRPSDRSRRDPRRPGHRLSWCCATTSTPRRRVRPGRAGAPRDRGLAGVDQGDLVRRGYRAARGGLRDWSSTTTCARRTRRSRSTGSTCRRPARPSTSRSGYRGTARIPRRVHRPAGFDPVVRGGPEVLERVALETARDPRRRCFSKRTRSVPGCLRGPYC